jgi:16S rRNA (guanine527-N7)-methyltransferase
MVGSGPEPTDHSPTSTPLSPPPGAGCGDLTDILAEARSAGFLGPGPLEVHLEHARGFVSIVRRLAPPASAPWRVADLGSGGGLPGLVMAVELPHTHFALIDANGRRARFLRLAADHLGLADRVRVIEDRAEVVGRDAVRRGSFDIVVARSFGAPAVTAECGAPLLKVGGLLVVSEPPGAGEHGLHRWPGPMLEVLGVEPGELVTVSSRYQVLWQRGLCPDRFPRRVGVPAKRPLF